MTHLLHGSTGNTPSSTTHVPVDPTRPHFRGCSSPFGSLGTVTNAKVNQPFQHNEQLTVNIWFYDQRKSLLPLWNKVEADLYLATAPAEYINLYVSISVRIHPPPRIVIPGTERGRHALTPSQSDWYRSRRHGRHDR
ncbi:MAG: hypothetical protein LCH80_10755, partial [Proteobacteria bacterium]|nr:hypothetical protein [Pseudomonadota bacterium]